MKQIKLIVVSSFFSFQFIFAQDAELKSIEEVISGIDSLLEEIDNSSNPKVRILNSKTMLCKTTLLIILGPTG